MLVVVCSVPVDAFTVIDEKLLRSALSSKLQKLLLLPFEMMSSLT